MRRIVTCAGATVGPSAKAAVRKSGTLALPGAGHRRGIAVGRRETERRDREPVLRDLLRYERVLLRELFEERGHLEAELQLENRHVRCDRRDRAAAKGERVR